MLFGWRLFEKRKWRIAAVVATTFLALALIDRASLLIAPCGPGGGGYSDQKRSNDDNCASREGIVVSGVEWLTEETPESWAAFTSFLIAIFTGTLWYSTDKLWRSGERQMRLNRGIAIRQRNDTQDQIRIAKESADAAKMSADAAVLNAKAAIDAERAHLYVVIKNETIKSTFQSGRMYDNSPSMEDSRMNGPGIQYIFKNFGKSPAILVQAMHGMFIDRGIKGRKTLVLADGALEVIGVDGESPLNTITYAETNTEPFVFGDARALATEQAIFFFYGEAVYTDAFGGRVTLVWEFLADGGKLRQTKHEERREAFPDDQPGAPYPPRAPGFPI
jgi:hypothetical protein